MPPLDLLLPFLLATALFAFLPGPGMVYMSIQTLARGRRAGWLSAAGFHLAGCLHIMAAAFGITLLLQAQPLLFAALKLAGAAYLIWMGVKLFLDGRSGAKVTDPEPRKSTRQAFRDSLIVELLNPKTALFFFAFLPQFTATDAAAPLWLQILLLGLLANLAFSLTDGLCILFSEWLAIWASTSRRLARVGRSLGGGLFIALGLLTATRSD
ncbi:MAG: LysE family translocator [Rhodospirillales bacterium]